jgi:hypothetical protein
MGVDACTIQGAHAPPPPPPFGVYPIQQVLRENFTYVHACDECPLALSDTSYHFDTSIAPNKLKAFNPRQDWFLV